LREQVLGDERPAELADAGEREGDGRVQVPAADAPGGVDGEGDGEGPADGDGDPPCALALAAAQQRAGDDAVAEQDEEHGADELGEEEVHGRADDRTGRARRAA
jgi:hypothetical protein